MAAQNLDPVIELPSNSPRPWSSHTIPTATSGRPAHILGDFTMTGPYFRLVYTAPRDRLRGMNRHISVQGSGTSGTEPDTCHIDLRVGATAPSVAVATETMSRAARAVMEALAVAGADQVSTARFTIRLDHDHQGQPSGFRAETSIRAVVGIEAGSGEAASRMVAAAVEAGGDHLGVDGLSFLHSDPTSVEHEASRAAVTDARARAEVMAEAAGVSVGEVISIEHTVHSGPGPLRFKAAMAEAQEMPVAPGTQTTTVEVRVTFALS